MDRRTFMQRATSVGLAAATPIWQRALGASVEPAEIRGHVVCGQRGLAGVRISDGYRIAVTDDSGEFRLPVGQQSGPFVFLTTPRGYWADRFYVPTSLAVSKQPVFRLEKRETGDNYRALYLTDVHLGEGRAEQSFARFEATVDEINRMDPLPAVCWVGGDITLQGGQGRRYVDLISRLKTPVRNAVGNHEMLVRQEDPRGQFQQLFGPTYYSFDIGPVHYVTLDGCRVNREAEGYRNIEGWLSPREMHWLAEDLRHVPDGMTTILAIHIPLVSDYSERRGTTADKTPYWIVKNREEVVDLLARYQPALVLQGHLHENRRLFHKGIEFVESISISGTWWKSAEGERESGVCGEPRGYRVLDVDGTRVRHQYQSSAESRVSAVGEIVGRPSRFAANKDTQLIVNIFDGCERTRVTAAMDDGSYQTLQPTTEYRHFQNLQPTHHWEWNLEGAALSPGKRRLKIRVEEPGRPVEHFEHSITI